MNTFVTYQLFFTYKKCINIYLIFGSLPLNAKSVILKIMMSGAKLSPKAENTCNRMNYYMHIYVQKHMQLSIILHKCLWGNSGCESSLHKKACYPKQQRVPDYSQLQPSIVLLSMGAT